MSPRHVAIVGATGAVGAELLAVLAQRRFPVRSLRLLASPRSAGSELHFAGESLRVEALGPDSFRGTELALFSAGGSVSRDWAPRAAAAGAVVVDNSSAFRMDPEVPLVVPECNADAVHAHRGRPRRRRDVSGCERRRPAGDARAAGGHGGRAAR
jgi:aspartate-semialdehyde dehydrogenase